MKAASIKSFVHSWYPAPEIRRLGTDEVHVWRACLDLTASQIKTLKDNLVAEEQKRAGRYYFQKDRERFIAARGILRAILSRYQKTEPDQLRFCYGFYGKPKLAGKTNTKALRFSLSHSQGMALYAVTRDREVGVDLEYIHPDLVDEDILKIAERFFSPREVAALRTLPAQIRREAFYNCWTCKEAYIKAKGKGLSLALDRFDVSLNPGEPAALLYTDDGPQETSRWSLKALYPGPGYVGALAVESHDVQIKYFQLD